MLAGEITRVLPLRIAHALDMYQRVEDANHGKIVDCICVAHHHTATPAMIL
jgi:hypothetical protein